MQSTHWRGRRLVWHTVKQKETAHNSSEIIIYGNLSGLSSQKQGKSFSVGPVPIFVVGVILCSTIFHAGWNIVAKKGSDSWTTILKILATIGLPAILAATCIELFSHSLIRLVWPFLMLSCCSQAVYFLGLTFGYRAGDLGVVYPITRALPVIFLGIFDLVRTIAPSVEGWIGLILIAAGCLVIGQTSRLPVSSDRVGLRARLLHPSVGWASVAAVGTVGYTAFDKLSAEVLYRESGRGLFDAINYGLWEFAITTVFYTASLWLIMQRNGKKIRVGATTLFRAFFSDWRIAVAGGSMFIAYSLVLWAYQLSERASYVIALRQFSIVLGVVAGTFLMRERAGFARITAALVIVGGIILISMAA